MRDLFRSSRSPIGLDVGGRCLNAVQLGRDRGAWRIDAACSIVRAAPGAAPSVGELGRFADVLERQGFQGTRAVVAVPATQLLAAQLDLPAPDASQSLDDLARTELASAHQADPARMVTASWPVATRSDATRVMAVGCESAYANGLLDVLEGAGFNVVALDVESLAIARACADRLGHGLSAALSIGWRTAQLVIVRDGVVMYERTLIDAGCSQLYDTLQDDLDLDADVAEHVLTEIGLDARADGDEALHGLTTAVRERILNWVNGIVPEIRMSMSYAAQESGQGTIDRLSLVGEGARFPGLGTTLAGEFGVEATVVAPCDLAGADGVVDCTSPALSVALGLALHGSR